MANAVAILASMFKINKGQEVTFIKISIYEFLAYCHNIESKADGLPCYHDVKKYLKDAIYPPNALKTDKRTLKRLALNFILDREILYRKSFDQTLLSVLMF